MKLACVHAIADLAQAELSDVVAMAYGGQDLSFGPDYIIPTPFDPRLILKIAPAVAKAAMESGVATRPILDLDAYRQKLNGFVYHSGTIMAPVFAAATLSPKRVVYAEGEEERVLRAVQVAVDEGLAQPILIGRPEVIETRVQRFGLRLSAGKDLESSIRSMTRVTARCGSIIKEPWAASVSRRTSPRSTFGNIQP